MFKIMSNISYILLLILVILTIVVCIVACIVMPPNSNEPNTDSKPKIRLAPNGRPTLAPGNSRIGFDIHTGTPILITY